MSVFSAQHKHRERVVALLSAVQAAGEIDWDSSTTADLALDVDVFHPNRPPSDATNYLGGIADVLEDKSRRTLDAALAFLRDVAVYPNDSQIQQVAYRWVRCDESYYTVRIRLVT